MLRYLNMFVLIGLCLIGLSLAGFATGNAFLTQPGEARDSWSAWLYLGAGALMLINGIVSIRNAPPQPVAPPPGSRSNTDEDTADDTGSPSANYSH